jgi:hypothetical protein
MRWSDTLGLAPSSITMSDRGLAATLHRTKTTGPGKKVPVIHIFVAMDASLAGTSWLIKGHKCWLAMDTEGQGGARDFFLPRPNTDLQGYFLAMATYAHASAMSQALFLLLVCGNDSGNAQSLFDVGVANYFTEHSERATIATWCQACRLPADVRKRITHHEPSCDENYIRCNRMLIEDGQRRMAALIRHGKRGFDFVDEMQMLQGLREYMMEGGCEINRINAQLDRLMYFNGQVRGLGGEADRPAKVEASSSSTSGSSAHSWHMVEEEVATEKVDHQPLTPVTEEILMRHDTQDGRHAGLGEWVISVTGTRATRRLHRVGECYRIPGIHYSQFEILGGQEPEENCYDAKCKICFSNQAPFKDSTSHSDNDSETASSSTAGTCSL